MLSQNKVDWNSPWKGSTNSLVLALVREPAFIAILLVFASSVIHFIEIFYINRELFQVWGNLEIDVRYSPYARMVSLLFIAGLLGLNIGKIFRSPVLMVYISVFFILLVIGFFRSFNYSAALSAGFKDSIPLLLILLGYVYRNKLYVFVYTILFLTIVNNLAQLFVTYPLQYFGVINGRPSFFGDTIYRAAGITDTGAYEFLNFCSMVLFFYFIPARNKIVGVLFFSFFGSLSMMVKSLWIFLAFLMRRALTKRHFKLLVLLTLLFIISPLMEILISEVVKRVDVYFLADITDRTSSYLALYDSIMRLNLIGEGLGEFGGPAAVKFNSPLHYSYISEKSNLITTDTYYPHVLIEYGLVGGFLFMSMVFLPLLVITRVNGSKMPYILLTAFILYISMASFVFEDLGRAVYILPLLTPILYNIKHRTCLGSLSSEIGITRHGK